MLHIHVPLIFSVHMNTCRPSSAASACPCGSAPRLSSWGPLYRCRLQLHIASACMPEAVSLISAFVVAGVQGTPNSGLAALLTAYLCIDDILWCLPAARILSGHLLLLPLA